MSTKGLQVSERQVAANQSNAQKSTGPRTPDGKARVALNAIKHGAYAKADNVRRHLMARRGEDPADYEQLHQDLVDSCQPEGALQAIVVKTIGDKVWDKLKLRRTLLEAQLGSVELGQVRFQRRQLAARRWPSGVYFGLDRGLCGSKDSPDKFIAILQRLDLLQGWFEEETCPDEYPTVVGELYGECPTVAGQQIRKWFLQLFDDDQARCGEAREELPKWIAKEKSDVEQDCELYRREGALRRFDSPATPEDEAAGKEAKLERQIGEQIRLLLQLKSKRSLWGAASEAAEAGPSGEQTVENPNGSGTDGDAGKTPGGQSVPPQSSQDRVT